jgi:hypothetical protein
MACMMALRRRNAVRTDGGWRVNSQTLIRSFLFDAKGSGDRFLTNIELNGLDELTTNDIIIQTVPDSRAVPDPD